MSTHNIELNCFYKNKPTPDVIQVSLHYLITRYTLKPCPGLANGVLRHIELLINHPHFKPAGVHLKAYQDLLKTWREISQRWQTENTPFTVKQNTSVIH